MSARRRITAIAAAGASAAALVLTGSPASAATGSLAASCDVYPYDTIHTTAHITYLGSPPATAAAGTKFGVPGVRLKVAFDDPSVLAGLLGPRARTVQIQVLGSWFDVTIDGAADEIAPITTDGAVQPAGPVLESGSFTTDPATVPISDPPFTRAGTWGFSVESGLYFQVFSAEGGQAIFRCVTAPGQDESYGSTVIS